MYITSMYEGDLSIADVIVTFSQLKVLNLRIHSHWAEIKML